MVWQKAKEVLRDELSESVFNLWIEPIECTSQENDTIQLSCPDRYFSAYISRNYLEMIQAKIEQLEGFCFPRRRTLRAHDDGDQTLITSHRRG